MSENNIKILSQSDHNSVETQVVGKNEKRFRKAGVVTVITLYLLILVGGIVRSTGSGMGCPDWPKCFGTWVPPTEVTQLPKNYPEVYAKKRQLKNEKLAKYLDKFGFSEIGERILNDPLIVQEGVFNPTKTWIEYVNRLLGVLAGFFIFFTLLFSIAYFKKDRIIFYLSLFSFVLVGFQGWLGSIVVSTNLLPGVITLHMILAIIIVLCIIFVVVKSYGLENSIIKTAKSQLTNTVLILCIIFSLFQIVFGTQVREAIDKIANEAGLDRRDDWIGLVGLKFIIHRSFSWIILGFHLYLIFLLRKHNKAVNNQVLFANILLLIVCIEFLTGIAMAYFGIPAFIQPIHLLLATVTVGVQFGLLLWMNPKTFRLNKYNTSQNQQVVY